MKIVGEHQLSSGRARVWDELNDTTVLKQCIPGCQSVEKVGPNEYQAVVAMKIGPVKATFKGAVILEEIEALTAYKIRGQGQGGMAGFASGEAFVTLAEIGPEETLLTYDVDAQIGGKIAQIGSRLVQGVVTKMSDTFFSAFSEHLSSESTTA